MKTPDVVQAGQDFLDGLASPTAAYAEGLRFFRGCGMANDALHRLAADLNTYGIDYAAIGAVALNQHGYQRFTADIDLLMSEDGLEKFRPELVGKFRQSKRNVPIKVFVSGEYPGDGKPKSVQFPGPNEYAAVIDGIKAVDLAKLIELKLASGMTGLARLKDLADVQELIRVKGLDEEFAEHLDPFVRDKYLELCRAVAQARAQDLFEEREAMVAATGNLGYSKHWREKTDVDRRTENVL